MKELTSRQRSLNLYHHIDPGFINYSKCYSILSREFIDFFEEHRNQGDDHWSKLYNDHLIVDVVLRFCRNSQVPTLGEALQEPLLGTIISSTEELEGTEDVYTKERVRNRVLLPYDYEKEVWIEFSIRHFVADTGRVEQTGKYKVSIIGIIRKVEDKEIVINPIIMGAPTFDHPLNRNAILSPTQLMWLGWDFYETFPEDIDQFSRIKDETDPDVETWQEYMKSMPEAEVKRRFCNILGESPRTDWGGEQADHFSASVSLSGRRMTAAFLLKGPANFREMTPEMLGKRADQIYRLACTPARLLIVQHCHQIGEAVRATLRAFAVSPHDPRHYCLIDGKDTYKILKAYGEL